MSRDLRVFNFENKTLRTATTENGDPLFNATDVCSYAGVKNVSDVLSRLEDDEKVTIVSTDSVGRPHKNLFVTESGFYDLVLSFRLRKDHPNYAILRRFKRWVTHDVLPAIRKTGRYEATPPDDGDPILLLLETARQTRLRQVEQEKRIVALESRGDEIEAKAEAALARCGDTGFMRIRAFCHLHNIRLTTHQMAMVGKLLRKQCDAHGWPYQDAKDEEYGVVKLWPIEALEAWRQTLPGQAA